MSHQSLMLSLILMSGLLVAPLQYASAQVGTTTTLAGTGTPGFADGPGTTAQFNIPIGVVVDGAGNVYIADYNNHRIRRIDHAGTVTTLAGTGTPGFADGPGTTAQFNDPIGVALDAAGNVYVADDKNHRIRRITGEPQEVTVAIDNAFAEPGTPFKMPIRLINNTGTNVGGLQFDIDLSGLINATFVELDDTLTPIDFQVSTNLTGSMLDVVVFSTTGAEIPPGDVVLGELCFTADDIPPIPGVLGTESPVDLVESSMIVGDPQGEEIPSTDEDGLIWVGIRGDLNLDGEVNILSVIILVRELIGKDGDTLPLPETCAYEIRDVTENGVVDVADVIGQVNIILDLPVVPPKLIANDPVTVRLGTAQAMSDGRQAIPVLLDGQGLIAGAQVTFTFDPTALQVGTPQFVGEASGLALDSAVQDGTLRVIVYSLSTTQGVGTGTTPMLLIPVTLRGDGEAALTLAELTLVNRQAQVVPVTMGTSTVAVTKYDAAGPSAFALGEARPNPFNPSTTIAYEVPQQANITLTVYNLLGQEVIRLVDQVQTPGRYRAVWNARNAQGLPVASGVYMYRLTSSSGYSDSKRMTLVK